jgi:hypothetical protein
VRWPFLAGLCALLVGLAVWQAQPRVSQWWQERGASQNMQAEIGRLRPAVAALNRSSVAGLPPSLQQPANDGGLYCVRGSGQILPAVAALDQQLRAAGAVDVTDQCANLPRLHVVCLLSAQIGGQHLRISAGPDVSQSRDPAVGVRISGGFGIYQFLGDLPRRAPRVALPTAHH